MTMSNVTRPVVVRRRRVIAAAAHHGGAWKVAYADFVTAMMAFFMMLWLLGATTDVQRKGIADYFAPTIPVARASGGADGMFGGETPAALEDMAFEGDSLTLGMTGVESASAAERLAETAALEEVAALLLGRGGESLLSDKALRHVVVRLTDEGLVIEVFSLPEQPLFTPEVAEILPATREIIAVIADVSAMVRNDLAVAAHVPAQPVVRVGEAVWPLSTTRAEAVRHQLVTDGVARGRLMRVTGHADRKPAVENPLSQRNDRFEVVFLRRP